MMDRSKKGFAGSQMPVSYKTYFQLLLKSLSPYQRESESTTFDFFFQKHWPEYAAGVGHRSVTAQNSVTGRRGLKM